ncbi:4Fe-4S dicluster domain-containing protein [Deferribacter autotrophicus]|uniref:4Fe-4S dicluster domain-containing protein n=1 Tax=Deferribacter autotrophicus TaxID=500465 RepID=UPI001FF03CAC|nr:4Fe-4S dicluster domain-containing protein [Deferribacter autotrophicus]
MLYFIPPEQFIHSFNKVTFYFLLFIAAIIFLDLLLVRYRFCATICPYSMLQSVLIDNNTLVIAMDPDRKNECINCLRCVKICPTGIDIRNGLNSACIACAKCIDECSKTMTKLNKTTLIDYRYGIQNKPRFLRTNIVILSAISAIFLAIFIFSMSRLNNLQVEIIPNNHFQPRYTNNFAINSYNFIFENNSNKEINTELSIKNLDRYYILPTNNFIIPPSERISKIIYIKIPKLLLENKHFLNLDVSIKLKNSDKIISKTISFRKPITRRGKKR